MNVFRAAVLGAALLAAGCSGERSASTNAGTPGAEGTATPAGTSDNPAPRMSRMPDSQPASGAIFTGSIVETMDAGGYTFVHDPAATETAAGDVWIAAPQFDAHEGEQISASLEMPMRDFTSPTLNRKFPLIYFVQEIGRNGQPLRGTGSAAAGSGAAGPASVRVEKTAPPPGGLSIADVFAKKGALSGKPVAVRGTVVKVTGNVLDRNWFHLQDGSGTASAHDNDLTVTSDANVKIGDVVTARGVLATDRDFGIGYAYDAILERASIQQDR
jgi:hypothetical protein